MFGTMAETEDSYHADFLQRLQQTLGPLLILLVFYYGYSHLTYETTIKRSLYEAATSLFPERIWHLIQRLASYTTGLSLGHVGEGEESSVKSGSLQKMYSGQGLSSVVQRARSMSRFDKFVNPGVDNSFPGLGNWDNSCFQNSILQGLASLSAFKTSIETSWRACVAAGTDAPALEGLQLFLGELQQEIQGRRTIWPPSVLRSMNTWQQQDAQEYLSKILDSIEKETTKAQKVMIRRSSPGLDCLRPKAYKESGSGSEDAPNDTTQREGKETATDLPPLSSLDGFLSQKLRCQKCSFSEGVSFTPFNCLTLNLGLGGNSYLESLLNTHFEPEKIDGVECDECTRLAQGSSASDNPHDVDIRQQRTPDADPVMPDKRPKVLSTKSKRILFGRLPHNLAVHINRSIFDEWGNQRKNTSFVEFPAQLKIWGDWVEDFRDEERDVCAIYELRCIITHAGRHDNGHYVACGKRGKEWFLFNDEIVTTITEADVLTRGNVFMLFYELVEYDPAVEVSTPKSEMSPAASPSLQRSTMAHESETEPHHAMPSEASTSTTSG